jgi:hypothetical protein
MGLDRETVALLHFIPLLEVAWSDGSVSAKERAGILEMARARGIMEGSPAYRKLLGWLGNRPDSVLFGRARTVMRDLLAFMTEDKRQVASRDLVAACEEIAAASGGILGLGSRTSAEERAVIEPVARVMRSLVRSRMPPWRPSRRSTPLGERFAAATHR